MKKTMKVLCLCMAVAMLTLCLFGCNSKQKDTYVIGATGPLTGSAASYGQSVQNGANLAIKEINEAGGLNGKNFSFLMMDDEAKVDKITNHYNTLVSQGMVASLGSVTSDSCIAFASKANADNLFYITPSASADDAIMNKKSGYRICFGDPDQGMYAAKALIADLNANTYTKIGVIYNTDDAYSSGLYAGFTGEMAAQNKADAYVTKTFNNNTNTNFTGQVSELKAAGCDLIFLPIYYQEASLIIEETLKQGYDADFYGCDGMDGIVKHVESSATLTAAIKGLKYLSPIDVESTDTKIKNFVDSYKAAYNAVPDQFAADAYDAVYVIYEAMKAAGVDDVNISVSDLCDKITTVLQGDFEYVGVTGTMTWDENGAAVKQPVTVEIK